MEFKAIRHFLLDMDGTFYLGNQLLDGSIDFIKKVEESGRDFMFLTNNSSHNALYYVEKLKKMGLTVTRDKVITSGDATAEVIAMKYPGKRVFLLGNEYLKADFEEAGIKVVDEDPEIVVIGFDTTLDYKKMWAVCDHVRAGLPYIATHPDFNCPIENGYMPDIGAIIAFIEASTGRRPDLTIGKPNIGIVEAISHHTGWAIKDMAMVGDRLYTDIETGRRCGMPAILVMTGETDEAMLAASETKPDYKFGRLSDMIPLLD
ncbi:MAG: HAD-IIA family hydrolase [Clostridia bacterium]|nr:HAD-IIA family hydrolase [Clostridia bacterium]